MNSSQMDMAGAHLPEQLGPLFNYETFAAMRHGEADDTWNTFRNYSFEAPADVRFEMLCEVTRLVGNAQVDQDNRDLGLLVAKQLLSDSQYELAAGAVNRQQLVEVWCEGLAACPPDEDDYGTPYSLYELSQIYAEYLGPAQSFDEHLAIRGKMTGAWHAYLQKAEMFGQSNPEWVENAVQLTEAVVPFEAAQNQTNPEWEWARKQPPLSGERKLTHDAVVNALSQQKSLKPLLAGSATEFKALAESSGLDITKYWNLTDPEQAVTTIAQVAELGEAQQKTIDGELAKFGLSQEVLAENPDLAKAMSDEIAIALSRSYEVQRVSLQNPQETLVRLDQQASLALEARKPSKVMEPIKKLLVMHGLANQEMNWQQIHELYSQADTRRNLITALTQTHDQGLSNLERLEQLQISHPYSQLRMGHRDLEDLHSGDTTRDCTAYHLENGFNAWTVPYWMLNPGFNLMYAVDQGQTVAKFGTLLALDANEQPRLVIDSVETSKYITDPRRALAQIQLGLHQIQSWADERGLGDVIFCTYTNSTELMENLPITQPPTQPVKLTAFGGLNGLREVRRQLLAGTGNFEESESSYLQSEFYADENEEAEESGIPFEATGVILKLERTINNAAAALGMRQGIEASEKLYRICQSANSERFLRNVSKVLAPRLFRSLDTSPELLYKLFAEIEEDAYPFDEDFLRSLNDFLIASADEVRLADVGDFDAISVQELNYIRGFSIELANYVKGVKDTKYVRSFKGRKLLADELESLANFFSEIYEIEHMYQVPLEDALQYIFGYLAIHDQASEEDGYRLNNMVTLQYNLPLLDRHLLTEMFGTV